MAEIKDLAKSFIFVELYVLAFTAIPFGGIGLVLFLFGDLGPFSNLLEAIFKVFVYASVVVWMLPALIFSVGFINNFYERLSK